MHENGYKNMILGKLSDTAIARLELRPVKLERDHIIESPGEEIRNIYFIEEGVGSMTTLFQDGSGVEAAIYGCESVIGVAAFWGSPHSLNGTYMHIAGHGQMCSVDNARREFLRQEEFHRMVLRYTHYLLVQTAQTAACNARHELGARMSRWLLLYHNRASSDVLELTQDFMSQMLGVRRPTVSLVAERLQREGLIEYHHGTVRILDRKGLEATSCECYKVVQDHLVLDIEADVRDGHARKPMK